MRNLLFVLSLAFAALGCAHAQLGVPWQSSPQIVAIASTPEDPRLDQVDAAIAYWNEQLQVAGSAFRLKPAERLIHLPPDAALQEQSRTLMQGPLRPADIPAALNDLPGELRIVLGDTLFVSHAGPFDAQRRRTVGIRSATSPPLSLPNVARNLIAHELGHAIGLAHNADATALMCGRPASCRPDIYQSAEPRWFPLLPAEHTELLRLYPADWRPRTP